MSWKPKNSDLLRLFSNTGKILSRPALKSFLSYKFSAFLATGCTTCLLSFSIYFALLFLSWLRVYLTLREYADCGFAFSCYYL